MSVSPQNASWSEDIPHSIHFISPLESIEGDIERPLRDLEQAEDVVSPYHRPPHVQSHLGHQFHGLFPKKSLRPSISF